MHERNIKQYGKSGQYIEYFPDVDPIGVILFYHGAGETARYGNITTVERHGIPKQLKGGLDVPYIVICPQLNGSSWNKWVVLDMLQVMDSYGLAHKHVTGLSLGGMAVYNSLVIAYEYNDNKQYFTTAVPVCGRTSTINFDSFKNVKVKIYHGSQDQVVPVGPDRSAFAQLYSSGMDIDYHEYIGAGHSIWEQAYDYDDPNSYWKWLES